MSARRAESPSRRKLVACKKHGLHYDPELHSGCTLCRKENPPLVAAVSANNWRVWAPFVLAILAVAAVLYFETRPQQATASGGPLLVKLEPRPYRTQIRTLEAVLYDPAYVRGDRRVNDAADQLATSIREREQGAASDDAADRLSVFGLRAADSDAAAARSEWETLRNNIFSEASWFGGIQDSTPVVARVDGKALAALRQTAEFGGRIIDRGAAATATLGGGSADEQSTGAWNRFATAWQIDVDALQRMLPPAAPPAADDEAETEATVALAQARSTADSLVGQLRQFLPVSGGESVPERSAREAAWADARDTLDDLRTSIERASQESAPLAPSAESGESAAAPAEPDEAAAADDGSNPPS